MRLGATRLRAAAREVAVMEIMASECPQLILGSHYHDIVPLYQIKLINQAYNKRKREIYL
jgi:hypothetical protein